MPEQLRRLIDELSLAGDYLVVNGSNDQPVALLTPLPQATQARRLAAGERLNAFFDAMPPSPLSEEEAIELAKEATASAVTQ